MPIRKVPGGYRYGSKGKVYPTRRQAVRQARAIRLSQLRQGTKVEAEEHHLPRNKAEKVARDHLREDDQYYTKLKRAGL